MRVRRLPRHAIITRLKARGIRQQHIAERAKVGQPYVSKVIGRHVRGTEGAERVWYEIERVLGELVARIPALLPIRRTKTAPGPEGSAT